MKGRDMRLKKIKNGYGIEGKKGDVYKNILNLNKTKT